MIQPVQQAKKNLPILFLPIAICVLAGCASAPSLQGQLMNNDDHLPPKGLAITPPTVQDLINKFQCEILKAMNDEWLGKKLKDEKYVVTAYLTADIQTNDGFNPTLSFITPRSVANTNLTKVIGAQWSGIQHKQYTQQVSLDLTSATDSKLLDICDATQTDGSVDQKTTTGGGKTNSKLMGDLGLKEIMETGLNYSRVPDKEKEPGGGNVANGKEADSKKNRAPAMLAFNMPKTTCDDLDKDRGDLDFDNLGSVATAARPVFGSTIEFTITLGVNGGPTWTLTRFKGPGGGGGGGGGSGSAGGGGGQGWLSYTNTEKDTLLVSFAPAVPGGKISPDDLEKLRKECPEKPDENKLQALVEQREATKDLDAKNEEYHVLLEKIGRGHLNTAEREDLKSQLVISNASLNAAQKRQAAANEKVEETKRSQGNNRARSAGADAAQAAQQNNTQMILQNLLNSTH